MKIYLYLIITALVVVGFSIWGVFFLSTSSEDVIQELETTNQALEIENWQVAQNSYQQVQEKWDHYNHIWPMLIEHREITDIEVSFEKMNVLMEQKDLELAIRECANLEYLLNHVARNEKINFQNIL